MGAMVISGDLIRGYTDVIILRVLLKNDSYGYEISKKITEMSGDEYTMKDTTLYSAFGRLEKSGYLKSYAGNSSGGGKRTYYNLTESGKNYYLDKCAEWKKTNEIISKFVKENI
ncbi:MAG: PadR family transcriptional regulator [Ruminococcus sp.]|nr:PadR family transcriptional regulator [Ruminococcus sp.]